MTTNTAELTDEDRDNVFAEAYAKITSTPSPEVKEAPEVVEEVPEPEAPVDEAPVEKVVEEREAAPQTYEQLVDSFPEDKREIVKQLLSDRARLEQQYRSAQGRLLAERRQRQAVKTPQTPPDAVAEQARVDYEKSIDEWRQVKEVEPTLAKAVDALTDAKVKSAVDSIRAELESRDSYQQRQAYESTKQHELDVLLEHVPNALEVVRSPEFQYWKDNVASPGIKEMAETSIYHTDALTVLQQYAPWAQYVMSQRSPPPQQQAPVSEHSRADAISTARQERASPVVRNAQTRPASPAPSKHLSEEEGMQLFEQYYNKIKNNR